MKVASLNFQSCSSLIVLSVFRIIRDNHAAHILAILPLPFKSHFVCTDEVIYSLHNAGHEITLFTSFSKEASLRNYSKIIDVSNSTENRINREPYNGYSEATTRDEIASLSILEMPFCDRVFKTEEYQEMLNTENFKFDVIFVEIHYFHSCFSPIAKKTGIPIIGVCTYKSLYFSERAIGNVIHPADVPYYLHTRWKFNTFYERLVNTWNYVDAEYVHQFYTRPLLEDFIHRNKNQLEQYSGFLDIEPCLIFSNSHFSLLPRPMNPNVIEIGGLHVPPTKPLPDTLLKFIEEAANGVILFTFGSKIRTSSLPALVKKVFIDVFAKIPQRVIWKYEDKMENPPENVMLMEWLPQRDILEHPIVKAFISHCGQGGVYEAVHTATPVLAFPLKVDQPTNAAILEELGVAIQLDINSICEDTLTAAINSTINDTKYYDNMQKLSRAFNDRPLTPQQSVVYWTEYVIKHKGYNLRPPSSRLNWFRYYLLDILCTAVASFVCILYLTYLFIAKTILAVKQICNRTDLAHKNK